MNKKSAVALAVGALFAAPVWAQSSAVEIYGRLYPQLAISKASGATVPGEDHANRWSVDTSNSRIGFRGREQLGAGLSTIWQIETRVRFDTGANNGFWGANRNSFLGLTGGFGTVKLGNMDTIYKEYGAVVGNFFGVSSGNFVSSSAVLSVHGLGLEDSEFDNTGFHIRAPNSVQYETPEFGGFQFGLQFSPDERKGNPGRDINSNLWSMGVKYEAGPLYASVQHERHNDWLELAANVGTGGTSSKDQATRLSVGYRITPNHRLTGDLARMEWKESGSTTVGDLSGFERTSWALGWEARWGGPWRTEITYVSTDDGDCTIVGGACDTDSLGATMLSLGAGYSLSKRTLIFALYSKLKNDRFATFSNTNTFDPNMGADTTSFAIGVSHSF